LWRDAAVRCVSVALFENLFVCRLDFSFLFSLTACLFPHTYVADTLLDEITKPSIDKCLSGNVEELDVVGADVVGADVFGPATCAMLSNSASSSSHLLLSRGASENERTGALFVMGGDLELHEKGHEAAFEKGQLGGAKKVANVVGAATSAMLSNSTSSHSLLSSGASKSESAGVVFMRGNLKLHQKGHDATVTISKVAKVRAREVRS
jgi:hypothetical protein